MLITDMNILSFLFALAALFWRCVIVQLLFCCCDVTGMHIPHIIIIKMDSVIIVRKDLRNMTTVTTFATILSTINSNHNLIQLKYWK